MGDVGPAATKLLEDATTRTGGDATGLVTVVVDDTGAMNERAGVGAAIIGVVVRTDVDTVGDGSANGTTCLEDITGATTFVVIGWFEMICERVTGGAE